MDAFDRFEFSRIFSFCYLPAVFAVMGGVVGCSPLDQRTFDPRAGTPPKPYIAPVVAPTPKAPFLQIMEGTPESDYAAPVETATKAALARKSNILFIIQGIAPMQSTPDKQLQILSDLTQNLVVPVAKRIQAAGALPIQIEMRASTDSTVSHAMVRVNVR
ncbi:hypothetical protein GS501_01955 [Saccharibacter sp. 17.LH.SD]|uniref:hypothetical protein n=1 Tax=Saccharibacter sp. 17.LH.SD TaxID=2689393 RepID=UPI0013702885|nr:hypothetical protein [Saccharibacter sp. 17.LH.SD]MXV43817.1 hypothetical protein [Saccharibacter sp. 17.LH.SD]